MGIDWARLQKAGDTLLSSSLPIEAQRPWIQTLTHWAGIVGRDGLASATGRVQLDALTALARDRDVYDLLLFTISTYLNGARALTGPSAKLQAIANLPEAILQTLATAECGIDFSRAPETFPDLAYDHFFSGNQSFALPKPGTKMDSSLLVTVAAIISQRRNEVELSALCDADRVRRLQQLLVHRLRNPAAHTYANFSMKDADFLLDLCADWLDVMAFLRGYPAAASMPIIQETPTTEDLSNLLWGHEFPIGGRMGDSDEGHNGNLPLGTRLVETLATR
jgi:hypothetical protein